MRQFNSEVRTIFQDNINYFNNMLCISVFPKGKTAWRIDWFGDIAFSDRTARGKQPSVLVHLSRITDSQAVVDSSLLLEPEATDHGKFLCSRRVSVSTIPLLRVGDVWSNGRLILRPDYQAETFPALQIDRSTTTLIKAGVSKDDRGFLLPLAEHPWHRQCTQSYCIEVSLSDGRRLIVPCMELIRFYFGSSSGLISKLFLPQLCREALYSDATFDQTSRHLTLRLAEKISGVSASDIGRLYLSSHAWKSAVAVYASLLKGSTAGQLAFPQAFFPFVGTTDLVAVGKWVSFAGAANSTFVVFNLRSCSHPFPFSSLKYELSDTGQHTDHQRYSQGTPRHIETPGSSRRAAQHTGAPDSLDQKLVERDASNRLFAKTQRIYFERKFPDLDHKPVWKQNVLVSTGAASESTGNVTSQVTEAAVGDPGSEQRIRPISLEMISSMDRQPPDFLRTVVEELRRLQKTEVMLLTASVDDGWTIPTPIQYDDDGKLDSRNFVEVEGGKTRRRVVSAFRFRTQDEHSSYVDGSSFYLVLIEAVPVYARFEEVANGFRNIWDLIDFAMKDFLYLFDYTTRFEQMTFERALQFAFSSVCEGPFALALKSGDA